MKRIFALAALAASMSLLTGCMATLGDLNQHASNLGKTLEASVTPADVLSYKAGTSHNADTMNLVVAVAKKSGGIAFPKADLGKVKFRDGVGRIFEVDSIKAFRFPVPQDVIDTDPKEFAPLMASISARLTDWAKTDAVEVIAVSSTTEGADLMASQLRKSLTGFKVTTKVGAESTAGYSGVELRALDTASTRVAAK